MAGIGFLLIVDWVGWYLDHDIEAVSTGGSIQKQLGCFDVQWL